MLAIAWRGRWLIVLFMLVGAGAAWALLTRTESRYTAASQIYVERNTPRILDEQYQHIQNNNFAFTQAKRIGSSSVLAMVAEDPDNANLETFREVDNRVSFLKEEINVSVGADDDIITIWTELPNAEDAAQLVNSVVNAYIEKYSEKNRETAGEVLALLRSEKQRRDAELQQARQALFEFRKLHPELAVQVSDNNVVTLRFAALSAELNTTEIDLLQAKARYNRVKKMYDTPSQRPFLLELAGHEQQAMRDVELERQVNILEQQLVTERTQWGEGHPRVKLLNESLTKLLTKLQKKQKAIIESFVESVRQEYELLDHKRSELQAAYDRQFEAATKVSALVTESIALQDIVTRAERESDSVEELIKEANVKEEATGLTAVNVLEAAGVAAEPSYPSRPQFLAIGMLAGAFAGFGLSWLRDLLDHRLRSVDEVAEVLQLPVLGMLPHMPASRDRAHVGRLVAHAPRCAIAEAVRTLRTALHFGLSGHETRTLCVTSPSPGDGKSTVASNLAIALAQADQRVLLIDADMRKPTQHLIFEVDPPQGLSAVLANRRPFKDLVLPTGIDMLDILPCGALPANPVELLNNGYFAEFLDQLKEHYDKIVIDSPPVMPVADSRVIAAVADSTLLVLRAERSARRLSLAARNELWRVRAKRLGVVVNGVPSNRNHSYGYGYGYGDYGYGQIEDGLPPARRKKSRTLPAPKAAAAGAGDEL